MIYSEFLKIAKRYPHKVALVYNDQKTTYEELDHQITLFSRKINIEGSMKHRRIIVLLKNSNLFVYTFFAINKVGAIAVPLSYKLSYAQLAHYIDLVIPSAIVCDANYVEEIDKIYDGLLFVTDYQKNKIDVFRKEQYSIRTEAEFQYVHMDLAEILFTSGTTGYPKGIMLSNENILENIKGIANYINTTKNERFLLIKPLHHSSTLNGELLLGLLTGKTIVLTNKILAPNTLHSLIVTNLTSIVFTTPSLLRYLLDMPTDRLKEINKILKIIHFYGASLPEHLLEELVIKYPDVELIYSYGLTEASPRVTYIKKADLILKPLSSGTALYNVELKIFDQNKFEELKAGEIGEICVRGKNVMKGYFNDIPLTNNTISDGWLKTGDLGFLDNEGYLFHKGRKDDLIIKCAINIYPAEIENIIHEISAVQDVLVSGAASLEYGRKIVAYVVVKQGSLLSKTDINKYVLTKLESIKCPDQIIFVDKLDVTDSGKIKRAKN